MTGLITYSAPDGAWNIELCQLSDAQGSVVSVVAAAPIGPPESSVNYAVSRTVEQLEYDPYERSRPLPMGDFNKNGMVSVQDVFDNLAAFFAPSFAADLSDPGDLASKLRAARANLGS